jgi:nucleotidyltransferase substrate binding protein (TIGR01987 family)
MSIGDSIPRWHYRFDNYRRAYYLLQEAMENLESKGLSQLEKEGAIRRFEYTWEFGWKVVKDYLEDSGIILPTITPTAVIKSAFAAKLISDAETWLRALDARNKMAHTYNFDTFEGVIADIRAEYLDMFGALYDRLVQEIIDIQSR